MLETIGTFVVHHPYVFGDPFWREASEIATVTLDFFVMNHGQMGEDLVLLEVVHVAFHACVVDPDVVNEDVSVMNASIIALVAIEISQVTFGNPCSMSLIHVGLQIVCSLKTSLTFVALFVSQSLMNRLKLKLVITFTFSISSLS